MFISLFGYDVHATFGFERFPQEPFVWFSKDSPSDWSMRFGRVAVYISGQAVRSPKNGMNALSR